MNKVLMSLLFAAFILTGQSFAQTPPPAAAAPVAPAAPVAEVPVAAKPMHRHAPEIRKAMHDLHLAKNHLQNAANDYGGHKAKAIEAIDRAIEELHEALDSEK